MDFPVKDYSQDKNTVPVYAEREDDESYCPICGNRLELGDSLVMTYYPPKNWWMVYHYSPNRNKESDYCGMAGFQITHYLKPGVLLDTKQEGKKLEL